MEIKKSIVYGREEAANAALQFPMEEELNLEPNMPDIERLVGQNFQFVPKQTTRSEGKVCIQGEVEYQILYAPIRGQGELAGVAGSYQVNQCLMMEANPEWELDVKVEISSVSVKRINSRKMSVFLLLEVKGVAYDNCQQEYIQDVTGEVEKKMGSVKTTRIMNHKRTSMAMKDVILLPSNRPDIGKILFQKTQLRGMEFNCVDGNLWIKAEAYLFLIYESETEERRVEYLELTSPLEGQVECPECLQGEQMICSYQTTMTKVSLAPNEDGEIRDIHLNMEVEIEYEQTVEEDMEYVQDIYALRQHLIPQEVEITARKMCCQQMFRVKVSDTFMPAGEDRLLLIYPVSSKIKLEEVEAVEGGALVEGTVEAEILYLGTANGQSPIMSQLFIPFHQQIAIPEVVGDGVQEMEFRITSDTVFLSANILDGTQAEVKAAVNLNLCAFEKKKIPVMMDLMEEPWEEDRRPGMIGYFVGKEDTLWKLAKENRTTVESICQINNLKSEELTPGMQILICQSL